MAALRLVLVLAVIAAVGFVLFDAPPDSPLPPPPPLEAPAARASEVADPPSRTLEAIAHCESRGDPTAVSPDGVYRGKYQFDLVTWQSLGGTGDPALASEREQDRRARMLVAERGTMPWPVCGSARAG